MISKVVQVCGRFNIIDDPLVKFTSNLLGIEYTTTSNSNVCPSELINTIGAATNQLKQIDAHWGIKPNWAKNLLINAQSETVAHKKTFKHAFATNRCVIPFSGWYEWKTQETGKKHKYLFENDDAALFMAGILIRGETSGSDNHSLITLTTSATPQCYPIHHRMPLLIEASSINRWIAGTIEDANNLLTKPNVSLRTIRV